MTEHLTYIGYLITKILNYPILKGIIAILFIWASFFFDLNNAEALTALFFLLIIDFVSGIIVSYKVGLTISSSKIFRTAFKITIYYGLISAAFLAEKSGIGFLPLDETIIAFLALTELISILENVALMGYIIPQKMLNKYKAYRDK